MARALTWPDVWRRRLAAHFLDAAAPATRLIDVVGAVCGIHARRMAEFYGVPAQLELGKVEPRGHM